MLINVNEELVNWQNQILGVLSKFDTSVNSATYIELIQHNTVVRRATVGLTGKAETRNEITICIKLKNRLPYLMNAWIAEDLVELWLHQQGIKEVCHYGHENSFTLDDVSGGFAYKYVLTYKDIILLDWHDVKS